MSKIIKKDGRGLIKILPCMVLIGLFLIMRFCNSKDFWSIIMYIQIIHVAFAHWSISDMWCLSVNFSDENALLYLRVLFICAWMGLYSLLAMCTDSLLIFYFYFQILLCLLLLERILLFTASPESNTVELALGGRLVTTILSGHLGIINYSLSSNKPDALSASALRLLTVCVMQGKESLLEILDKFDFGSNRLVGLVDRSKVYDVSHCG